jgi:hypothetical protein
MAAASDWLENKLVDYVFRGRAWTPPATLYLALFTAAPSDSGGGTEVSASGYARVAITSGYAAWKSTQGTTADEASTGTGGQTVNAAVLSFPTPTANWGTVTHVGLFDASTSGNLVAHGALTSSKTVNLGQAGPSFSVGALTITVA